MNPRRRALKVALISVEIAGGIAIGTALCVCAGLAWFISVFEEAETWG